MHVMVKATRTVTDNAMVVNTRAPRKWGNSMFPVLKCERNTRANICLSLTRPRHFLLFVPVE